MQRAGVELAQHRAQRVGLPLPGPDHALVGADHHLDVLGHLGVPGHRPVMGPIEADQLGQGVRVTGVALGTGSAVALPVAGHLQQIDRKDGVAGGDQRLHPWSAVGLDADQHLLGFGVFLEVVGDQRMQYGQSFDPLGQPAFGQPPPGVVLDLDVVMGLGSVIADEQHPRLHLLRLNMSPEEVLQRANGSVLDGTTSHQPSRPPHRPGGARFSCRPQPRSASHSAHRLAARTPSLPEGPAAM
jgi:hypothetical protein